MRVSCSGSIHPSTRVANDAETSRARFVSTVLTSIMDFQNQAPSRQFGKNVPQSLWQQLYPFQRDAVAYACQRHGRVLLADEMGLGKTIQAIAILHEYIADLPVLVVCQSSTRKVWVDSLQEWLIDQVSLQKVTNACTNSHRFRSKRKNLNLAPFQQRRQHRHYRNRTSSCAATTSRRHCSAVESSNEDNSR